MTRCVHPGCLSIAASRDPRYCWGHYVDHVLLGHPCPGAPKRVRLVRTVPTAPLRERLEHLVAEAQAATRTHDGENRTFNHIARERHMSFRALAQLYEKEVIRWDVADRIAVKLGTHVALLYGFGWTAMDVEDAA